MARKSPAAWKDQHGRIRRVPVGRRLHFQFPSHAALRAFVFWRDGYICRGCGASVDVVPANFNGRSTLWTNRLYTNRCPRLYNPARVPLVIDHVVSRRNGGSHHPKNLQTLCYCCNSAKASLVDAKARAA